MLDLCESQLATWRRNGKMDSTMAIMGLDNAPMSSMVACKTSAVWHSMGRSRVDS